MEEKKKLYPLSFTPITLSKPWGEETCAISDLESKNTLVNGGWLDENSLADLMETYIDRLAGDNVYYFYGRQFPLSVRWMDATGRTPVMVCPDDEVSSQRYDSLGRKKLWYIADIKANARIGIGLKEPLTASGFYYRCLDGTLAEAMNFISPEIGDAFLIEPGTVHYAEGVKILELSECSELDFQVCGHTEASDIESAAAEAVIDFVKLSASPIQKVKGIVDGAQLRLTQSEEFNINEFFLNEALHISSEQADVFSIYTCVRGEASLQVVAAAKNDVYILKAGESLLVPAEVTDYFLAPMSKDTILLEATLPHKEFPEEYINQNVAASVDDEKPSLARTWS